VVSVAVFSCKRTDEVNPVQQTVDQPNDSLKIQGLTSTVIAGSYDHSGAADGTGTGARFHSPMGIFTKSDGSLLVADNGNRAIRKISTARVVTTPYHLMYGPTDVAAINDGAVGVVNYAEVIIFNHGTHVTRTVGCCHYGFAGIDKNPGSTFFWQGQNGFTSESTSSKLLSINESLGYPLPEISITDNGITSFSIAANDNKFLTTLTQVVERTHGGAFFLISSGFFGLTSIIANHDGSRLYVADQGNIKLITRTPTFKPVITLLIKGAGAYGLTLSNDEKVLYFTNNLHHTVNRVALP
jgi:sugar lactone lactonase YvrE